MSGRIMKAVLTVSLLVLSTKFAAGLEDSSDKWVLLHPCLENEYWNNGTCKQCSTCMTDQEVTETCSKTKDTVCQCKSGSYLDSINHICRSCRQCPTGSRIFRECSAFSDTHCSPCPEGTFHNIEKNVCQKCQECLDGEAEADACGPTSDRVCVNQSVALSLRSFQFGGSSYKISGAESGYLENQASSSHAKRDSPAQQEESLIIRLKKKSTSVDPIFCLPPAFVIIVLVCYAGLRSYENAVDRKVALSSCFSTDLVSHPRSDVETGLLQSNTTQVSSITQPRIYPAPVFSQPPAVHVPYGRSVSTVNEVVPQRGRTGTSSTNRTSLMNSFGVPSTERELTTGPMIENLPSFVPTRILNSSL